MKLVMLLMVLFFSLYGKEIKYTDKDGNVLFTTGSKYGKYGVEFAGQCTGYGKGIQNLINNNQVNPTKYYVKNMCRYFPSTKEIVRKSSGELNFDKLKSCSKYCELNVNTQNIQYAPIEKLRDNHFLSTINQLKLPYRMDEVTTLISYKKHSENTIVSNFLLDTKPFLEFYSLASLDELNIENFASLLKDAQVSNICSNRDYIYNLSLAGLEEKSVYSFKGSDISFSYTVGINDCIK